jgi:hypothetical protein
LSAGLGAPLVLARASASLRELVKSEPYRSAWTQMLAKERDLPAWVKDFNVTGEGANPPAQMVPVGVKAYLLATLCMGQDCAGHKLYVLFNPDGTKAVGELVEKGKATRWLGKPSAAERAAFAGP